MSARVWTREELDRVHPLPDGWTWARELDDPLFARGPYGSSVSVCRESGDVVSVIYDEQGRFNHFPPALVALAVILASQGLDSREAMADALDRRAVAADRDADVSGRHRDGEADSAGYACEAQALRYAAAMLRRGTVDL
jgi:hypothetical protein